MTNEITTVQATSVQLAVSEAFTPALSWATKSGKEKHAYTPAAAARGNRAARLAAADAATVAQLCNNTYRPFLRDVASKLTTAHVAGLRAHVAQAVAVVVDGVPMLPAGDVLTTANKKVALAVVDWLIDPTAIVKKETVSKALPRSCAYLADIAVAWAEATTATEATTEAEATEADAAEAEATEADAAEAEATEADAAEAEATEQTTAA